MAQATVQQYNRRSYNDLSGGLSTRQHALKVAANKFTQLDNCVLADHDTLDKAPGYVSDGTPWANVTDSFIRMIVNYRSGQSVNSLVVAAQDDNNTNATYKVDLKQTFGDGTYSYIGYTTGTALFTSSSAVVTGTSTAWDVNLKAGDQIKPNSGSTWYVVQSVDSATQVTLTGTYAGTTTASVAYMARIVLNYQAIPAAATFNSHLVIVDGIDKSMVFDNTTLSILQSANAPIGSFIAVHKNRVFIMTTSSTLWWSAVNDETTWAAASNAPIYPNDNGNTVGICPFANSLIVFKDNGKVYQVYGEFDQSAVGAPALIREIDSQDNIGVIAGRSAVVNDDNTLYFMAQTGVYTIDPRMFVTKVSWDISPTIQNLVFTGGAALAAKSFAFAQKSQWDAGTLSSTQDARPTNSIAPYFDSLPISGAFQGKNAVACTTTSNHDVHIAWISADGSTVKYTHWLASDNTSSTQDVFNINTALTYTDGRDPGDPPVALNSLGARSVCVAVANNGNIGIGILILGATDGAGVLAYGVVFSEFSGGVWNSVGVSIRDADHDMLNLVSSACTYNGGNAPYMAMTVGTGFGQSGGAHGDGIAFFTRPASTWVKKNITDGSFDSCDFTIDGSGNIYLVASNGERIFYIKSTDGGGTWTYPLTGSSLGTQYVTASITAGKTPEGVHVRLDDTSNVLLSYLYTAGTGSDLNSVIEYNLTPNTPTKATVDTSVSGFCGYLNDGSGAETFYEIKSAQENIIYDVVYSTGTATITNGSKNVTGQGTKWTTWVQAGDLIKASGDSFAAYGTVSTVNSDTSITLVANYGGTSVVTHGYLARHRYTVTSASPAISAVAPYGSSAISLSGGVLAVVGFSASSGQIAARRISVFAQWTSAVLTDSALSAWGTFVVGGEVAGGNTVRYEIGLSTTGTILVVNTGLITSGSLISTNATLNHAKAVISFILQAFAASSVASITLNYSAPGVAATGSIGMCGFVFNNELFISAADTGSAQNSSILLLDWKHAWGRWTIPVFCFARMSQTLYAGSSTGGTVYRLKTGYNAAGSAYAMTAVTKEDLLGDTELQKDLYKAYVVYKVQGAGTFTFSYSLDNYINGAASWVDTTVTQTSASNTPGLQEIPIGQTCSSIQFKVSQASADVQVGIVGVTLLFSYLNLR